MPPEVKLVADGDSLNTVTMIPGSWAHGWFSTVVKSRVLRGSYSPSNAGQWFDEDSPFVTSSGINGMRMYVVCWSERNSVADRRKASVVLARHLEKLSQDMPNDHHHIVAHSHGGNIALLALARIRESVDLGKYSFASISTPFIWSRPRDVKDVEFINGGLSGFGAFVAALFLYLPFALLATLCALVASESKSLLVIILGWIGVAVMIAAFVTVLVGLGRKRGRVLKNLKESSGATLLDNDKDTFASRLAGLGSVLVLQPPADEAYLSLVLPAFLMWLNRVTKVTLKRWLSTAFRKSSRVLAALYFLLLFVPFVLVARNHNGHWMAALGGSAMVLSGLGVLYWCLTLIRFAFAMTLGIIGSFVLRTYGYGFAEGFVLTLGSDMHVEHYPPGGPWLVYCASGELHGLSHSLYNSPEIQEVVARWMKWVDLK